MTRIQIVGLILMGLALIAGVVGALMESRYASDERIDAYYGTAGGSLTGQDREEAKSELFYQYATPWWIGSSISLATGGAIFFLGKLRT